MHVGSGFSDMPCLWCCAILAVTLLASVSGGQDSGCVFMVPAEFYEKDPPPCPREEAACH